MDSFYLAVALVTAGISLSMGFVSLRIGLSVPGKKSDLTLSVLAILLAAFILFPPIGFITSDTAANFAIVHLKRVFIFAYYSVLPWFFFNYSKRPGKSWPIAISLFSGGSYFVMLFTEAPVLRPLWTYFAFVLFAITLIYGVLAISWTLKSGERKAARWLILAMSFYGLLFLATTMYFVLSLFEIRIFGLSRFFPMHLHTLAFMPIMGASVIDSVLEKFQLEKKLEMKEREWQSLINTSPLIIVEFDIHGRIAFINNFGIKLLGYSSESQLLNLNWFETFVSSSESSKLKALYDQFAKGEKQRPFVNYHIKSKSGNYVSVSWMITAIYSEDGSLRGIMSSGRDVTAEEASSKTIRQLRDELEMEKVTGPQVRVSSPGEIIGTSESLSYVLQKAQQVAATHAPVLLEGETGVGKDILADHIHRLSARSHLPMIKVNCGALPKDLIEDELFGHEKGAFTSAIQARKGKFELADGGTIFLDEIGELPLEMQPKLLRVLQSGEFDRIGGQKTIKVDVRIISATNKSLDAEIKKGRFRDDLFYRLNVFPITIPPLRSRKEDLSALINHFVVQEAKKYQKKLMQISRADLQRLMSYQWPGNIRELKNVIERSVITSETETLRLEWFFNNTNVTSVSKADTLEQVEKDHIIKTMEQCHWKINGEKGAAAILDMHPNTLRSKMKKLGVFRPGTDKDDYLAEEPAYSSRDTLEYPSQDNSRRIHDEIS